VAAGVAPAIFTFRQPLLCRLSLSVSLFRFPGWLFETPSAGALTLVARHSSLVTSLLPLVTRHEFDILFSVLLRQSRHSAFTLIELLVVIAIIAIALGFLIPSLGTGQGRSAEAAARQLTADLDGARLTAIAERTRTRVLFPTNPSNFTNPSSTPGPWPNDISYRGYLVVSEKRTEDKWKQRGKWNRLPTGIAFASLPSPSPTAMPIDASGTGSTRSYDFKAGTNDGSYIEFLANGSSNLDPTASVTPAPIVADGFVDSNGKFVAKNKKLQYTITVDPLTGAVSLK
jgi:prepilin-type N-terminal cleavage/methylation domain-containing protein